jgi:NAD(P) transhydrogenase subunit alpha
VVIDLAVERGGNVEGSQPDQVVQVDGVTIIGYSNMAGRIAASSSALLARNIYAFVEPMIDKGAGALKINREDPIVAATLLTADGAVVHPAFAPKAPAGEGGPI